VCAQLGRTILTTMHGQREQIIHARDTVRLSARMHLASHTDRAAFCSLYHCAD
jgi:hypothetical protein